VAGILGIVCTFTALVLSLVRNTGFNFDFSGGGEVVESVLVVMSSFIISLGIVFAFFGRFTNSKLFKTISLQTSQNASEGYQATIFTNDELKLKNGIAASDLRPSGKIEIDGEYHDAQTDGEFIMRGEKIKVVDVKNTYLIVRRI
jgi:membrane-bound serine protease (ClpP class)